MKKFISGVFLVICSCTTTLAKEHALRADICSVAKNPGIYNAKTLQIRGTIAGSEGGYYISEDCGRFGILESGFFLVYPNDQWHVRASFRLIRNADFRKFEHFMEAPALPRQLPKHMPPSSWKPRRYCSVTATITGRFDAVSVKEARLGRGFGNAGSNRFELVVKSVANPVAKECPNFSSD